MAFWPFGRKKRKIANPTEQSMGSSRGKERERTGTDPGCGMSEVNASRVGRKPNQRGSMRGKRASPRKLSKSQSRSRLREPEKTASTPPIPTLPKQTAGVQDPFDEKATAPAETDQPSRSLAESPTNRGDIPSYYFQNPLSNSSLQPEKFSVAPDLPTLRSTRSTYKGNLPRRKSSKRKADDHAREQEVKAMSSPIPIPKRSTAQVNGVLSRESGRAPSRRSRNIDRPTSEVSLPIPDSMRSSLSGVSDGHSFKISALDALSPRPTIKYTENPRYIGRPSSLGPSRVSTKREKGPAIPEAGLNSKERIDDLADELDASALRELMERDQRRRENKRKCDQEKLQRRLQRKSERQKNEMKPAPQGSAENRDETVNLDIGEAGAAPSDGNTAVDRRHEPKSLELSRPDLAKERNSPEDPFKDPMAGLHAEDPTPADEKDEPILETAKAIRMSQASVSPPASPRQPRGPSQFSMLSDFASRSSPDIPDRNPRRLQSNESPRESDISANLAGSWSSFFKRVPRAKRSSDQGRATPSEFSNTSRESFSRQPPPVFTRNVRTRSGTPVRTQSKFREDLPELPISPPTSRVQSPDLSHTPSILAAQAGATDSSQPLSDIHPAFREEIALSRHQSLRGPSPDGPSSALLSQSLASVDSEGSWLSSGRPTKRSSQQANLLRGSAGSLQQRLRDLGASEDELGMAADEYFTRLTPGPENSLSNEASYSNRQLSEFNSGDNEGPRPPLSVHPEEGATLRGGVARQPTIVRRDLRAKSREGLLDIFQADEESSASSPSEEWPAGEPSVSPNETPGSLSLHRATSVDIGGKGHARHISAGSARLLNLPPRASGDLKRLSSSSVERSPLRPSSPDEGVD